MQARLSYHYSFKVGAFFQLLLLPVVVFYTLPGLLLSLLNVVLTLFFYPAVAVWLLSREWKHIPPALGPHQ